MEEIEKKFKCPFCAEKISFLLDLSVSGPQTYVEDCEVCCRAIQVSFDVVDGKLTLFRADKAYG
jgi:transcription elongation factor Elf1